MAERRIHSEGTYAHFVTFSCFKRRKLLAPDICKKIVIGTLNRQIQIQNDSCTGFVIMEDHVHALIWFPIEHQISACMDKWKEISSKEIAAAYHREFPNYASRFGKDDPVWQSHYYGFNIFSEKKLREKLIYMHNNPVRAGLVAEACDWPWSSARWWHLGKSVGITISWPP